ADVQVARSGVIDNAAASEDEAFELIRRLLSFMPQNVYEAPPRRTPSDPVDRMEDELLEIVPRTRTRSYSMHRVLQLIFDDGDFFEVKPEFGRCVITGFARLNGYPVAVTAHNPRV